MKPKFESMLYPSDKMDVLRRAMKAARVSGVPTNRDERRRLNEELRKLGAPELQVTSSKRPSPVLYSKARQPGAVRGFTEAFVQLDDQQDPLPDDVIIVELD